MSPPQGGLIIYAMRIVHFPPHSPAHVVQRLDELPPAGLVWIDCLRYEAADWGATLEPWLQKSIDARHVLDSLNPLHRSFLDGTDDYDMLILQGLGAEDAPFPLKTLTAVFFLFDRVLVTVRAPEAPSFNRLQARIDEGRIRGFKSPLDLAHQIWDAMIDRFLGIREMLDHDLDALQDDLLEPDNGMNDWRLLLNRRREVRRLESLCSEQLDTIDAFRRGARVAPGKAQRVQLRDLAEHIERVRGHASNLERDLEAAVQLHFAVATERTNRVVQTLTVISAIFFPLTLITGLYGMNFQHMPELAWRYGYFIVLGVLLAIGAGLLLLFKRRGYF